MCGAFPRALLAEELLALAGLIDLTALLAALAGVLSLLAGLLVRLAALLPGLVILAALVLLASLLVLILIGHFETHFLTIVVKLPYSWPARARITTSFFALFSEPSSFGTLGVRVGGA
jgi:hypothetical protein